MTQINPEPAVPGTKCTRLLSYALHETHSKGGTRCDREAVDMGGPTQFNQQARCARHRGVDARTTALRERRARRDLLLRKGGNK